MSQFKVISIIDGETIAVAPEWQWSNRDGLTLKGSNIRVTGYTIPGGSGDGAIGIAVVAKAKLTNLLLNQYIDLKNPKETIGDSRANIECSVYLNGVDISKYFPEFQGA